MNEDKRYAPPKIGSLEFDRQFLEAWEKQKNLIKPELHKALTDLFRYAVLKNSDPGAKQ